MAKKINARNKGNSYERKIAEEMRELGFTSCVTSRSESKRMDDKGVDLMYTGPFHIQLKATERYPNFHQLLTDMGSIFHYPVVFNKKNRKGEVVVMRKEDFYKIIRLLIASNAIGTDESLADSAE